MRSPEDIQKELVQARVRRAVNDARRQREAGVRDPAYDPTEGMGGLRVPFTENTYIPTGKTLEKFLVGNTSGWDEGLRGAVNLVLPDSLTPKFASDKRLREIHESNRALKETGAGFAGNLIGGVASTAPVGGGSVGLTRAAAANIGGRVLKAASSLPVRAGIEGAITSAAMSSPDAQGESAGVGALVGGGMGLGGKVLGRALQGIAKESPEALNTKFLAASKGEDAFVPVAQAVGDKSDFLSRVVKTVYKEGLPYVPGVSGQFRAQASNLAETFRNVALKEADHFDVLKNHPKIMTQPAQAVKVLRKAIDDGFNSIKGITYKIKDPARRVAQIAGNLRRAYPKMDVESIRRVSAEAAEHLDRFADGGQNITGENLLNAKNAINRAYKEMQGPERAALTHVVEQIEQLIYQNTPKDILKIYQKARGGHADVTALEKAIGKNKTFSPSQLAQASKKSPGLGYVAENFDNTMRGNVGVPGAAGRFLSRAAAPVGLGATGAGLVLAPMLTGAALAGGNALASKTAQKVVMGTTRPQQALIKALRKGSNEERAQILGSLGRATATTQLGER